MVEGKNKQKHERAAGGKINMKTLASCQYSQKHKETKKRQPFSAKQLRPFRRTGTLLLRPRLEGTPASSFSCWFLVTESCLTLCDPLDWSPPGSSVPGVLQARILNGVAISSSTGSS